jgi:two-component system phosphate regulon response regulator PhoB
MGPTEFKLLNYLMKHPERVHSRAQLLDKVWGDHVFIEERTVDVHVKRLREALGVAGGMVRPCAVRATASAPPRPRQGLTRQCTTSLGLAAAGHHNTQKRVQIWGGVD